MRWTCQCSEIELRDDFFRAPRARDKFCDTPLWTGEFLLQRLRIHKMQSLDNTRSGIMLARAVAAGIRSAKTIHEMGRNFVTPRLNRARSLGQTLEFFRHACHVSDRVQQDFRGKTTPVGAGKIPCIREVE